MKKKAIGVLNLFCLLCVLQPCKAQDKNLTVNKHSFDIEQTYITPVKIIDQQNVINSEQLLKEGIHQADLNGKNNIRLENNANGNAYIIIDFGKEIHGGIQLVTGRFKRKNPINIRVRFGESVSETCSDVGGEGGATNEHSLRDFKTQVPWMGKIDVGSTGFRFVRIDLLEDRKLLFKEISAISSLRDIPYLGSFNSNDELLNTIWQTGAYTVHLNMQEYLWDGIKRDRLVWVGDMHPEVMTINSVFGYNEVIPKSLDYIRDVTPSSKWMNNISSYSMWWILIHQDWYMAHGNKKYLQEQYEYLKTLVQKLCLQINEEGVEELKGTRFLDWPTSKDKKAIKQGYQSLMILTLEASENLFQWLDDQEMASFCKANYQKMKGANLDLPETKQAAALMYLAATIDKKDAEHVIAKGKTKDFSTFYGYYMLNAMSKAGNHDEAIQMIREYWGGMIELGATSFWEHFDIDWLNNANRIDELIQPGKVDVHRTYGDYCFIGFRHSLCHGWASGPTAWLTQYVLGVNIVEPGTKKIKLDPHLGDLNWVEGTYPTSYGTVWIRHERKSNGEIHTVYTSPKEVTVIVNK